MDGKTKEVEKTRLTVSRQILLLVLSAVSIYGYGLVLKRLGGNLPFIDSMSTCLSVLAMLLSVRRLMEQWIVWIVVDVVTVFMWFADYQKGGTDIATPADVVHLSVKRHVYVCKMVQGKRGTCQ